MSKAFVVVCQAGWVAEELRVGVNKVGGYDFYTSYGWDLPRVLFDYDEVAWWMPGEYGARVQRLGLAEYLTSPGAYWMTHQDRRFTGRSTWVGSVSEFLENPPVGEVFVKPADVKIDFAPASVLCGDALLNTMQQWPRGTIIQSTDRICDFSDEYRFYVVDDDIMTGSVYLQNGVTVYDGAKPSRYAEALLFASRFLVEGKPGRDHPESFVLDVGFDTIANEWLVIEANPTWSSGFYQCDIGEVVHAIHRASNPIDFTADQWCPDPYLLSKVSRKVDISLF